jgi:hypothetical protein
MIQNMKIALVSFILAILLFFCNREKSKEDRKNNMAERIKTQGEYLPALAENTEKK